MADKDRNTTTVVNIKKEECTRYIGRGPHSIWGNPYAIGRDGSREEVIEKYRKYILGRPDLLVKLPTLKGHKLGCYCAPLPCHGDVLIELIEKQEKGEL